MRPTTRLPLTSASVGTVLTRKRSASSGCSSISTAVTRRRARSLRARCAIRLSIRRAGPELAAPKKTRSGRLSLATATFVFPANGGPKPTRRRATTLSRNVGVVPDRPLARPRDRPRRAACRVDRPSPRPRRGRRARGRGDRSRRRVRDRRLARPRRRRDRRRARSAGRRGGRHGKPSPLWYGGRYRDARRPRRAGPDGPRSHPVRRLPRGGRGSRARGAGARAQSGALRRPAQPRARLMARRKKLILAVIDGLTPDVFEDAVETGSAP